MKRNILHHSGLYNNLGIDNKYMTVHALEDGLTIGWSVTSKSSGTLEYRIGQNGVWTVLSNNNSTPSINAGQFIQFKGDLKTSSKTSDYSWYGIGQFTMSKQCKLMGNCMSLLYGDSTKDDSKMSAMAFYKLFYNCKKIVEVSETFLPATTLATACYDGMFYGCTSLTKAPELPATILTDYCYNSMFNGCVSLAQAPELPATVLAADCYCNMFLGCTSLAQVPELPATTLAEYCYFGMFKGCTSITQAPELPVTTLKGWCYGRMFSGCTSITQAPELPATELVSNCYREMFRGCTSLTEAPELRATTIAEYCYYYMFLECTGLTTAPELPATTLADYCYSYMFTGCTGLTIAPELPATTLNASCYDYMFLGCSNLNYIKILANDLYVYPENQLDPVLCTTNWVLGVSPKGKFVTNRIIFEQDNSKCPIGWDIEYNSYDIYNPTITLNPQYYLTFNIIKDGHIGFKYIHNSHSVYISKDKNTWMKLLTIVSNVFKTSVGETYYVCGSMPVTDSSFNNGYNTRFDIIGGVECSGDVKSLYNYNSSNFTYKKYCFSQLFSSCLGLITPPTLSSTQLSEDCYDKMFYGCTGLITAPKLPATTLAKSCYEQMFSGCTGLTTTPELPATTLAAECYRLMFDGCTSLTQAPVLPATTLTKDCYRQMFYGCTGLTTAPELPATTLATACYYDMFCGCTGLTTAPELPATTLAAECYSGMFYKCTGLINAPELPAKTLTTLCYYCMFLECTSLTTAPILPAKTLTTLCYMGMFYGCKKLNNIKMYATDISASSCLSSWVYNVASKGTFTKHEDATWTTTGTSGVPSGWTIQKIEYAPTECTSLSITANDVNGRKTNTVINYTANTKGYYDLGNTLEYVEKVITGTATSEEFPQNTSYTDTIQREISFTYMGVTATTTITQGVWVDQNYTINLNSLWQQSSVANPDSTLYDGVYESYSNKGTNNSGASMYITINGYSNFKLYIRSYAQTSYDYVMVSQLDKTLTYSSSYSNSTLVKAHTRGSQSSGTALSNYKLVEFTDIDGGEHTIQIIYRKNGSTHSNNDCGYVLIPKDQ